MLELNTPHLDDFTLLRYVAEDLDEPERKAALAHLLVCGSCEGTIAEIAELDQELRAIASNPATRIDFEIEELPDSDPFRRRPRVASPARRWQEEMADFTARAVFLSEEGGALSIVILDAAKASTRELSAVLGRLDLSDTAHRFALLFALQDAGKQIAENPRRLYALAESAIDLIRKVDEEESISEAMVSLALLSGQAHQLAGQACLWTGELDSAGTRFQLAYRAFAIAGDDVSLATTEQLESQRRIFSGRGSEGLTLIRRAAGTFEDLDLSDSVARAQVVEGLALFSLRRFEEAIEKYRRALPVFEGRSLWSNYVGAVNSLGTALSQVGRLGDARREFARALRRLSREQHRSWVGFIRMSLAEVLLSSDRCRDAAVSSAQAARVFAESGLTLHRLKACLFEIESWARAHDLPRARHRFQVFRQEVGRLGGLDGEISRQLEEVLSGSNPDFQKVSELRREAAEYLEERLTARRA